MNRDHRPGLHILADLYGSPILGDEAALEAALRRGAQAAGARVLDARFHHFGAGAGVTGVLLLAESHISIHTWPEHDLAAVDIFMCGKTDARAALAEIEAALNSRRSEVTEVARGAVEGALVRE